MFEGSCSLQFSEVQNVCCTAREHIVFSIASHMEHASTGHCHQTVYFYLRVFQEPKTEYRSLYEIKTPVETRDPVWR